MLFITQDCAEGLLPGTRACTFLSLAFESHHGIQEGYWAPQTKPKSQQKGSTATNIAIATTTMLFVCRRCMGRLSTFRLYSLYKHGFTWWAHLSTIRLTHGFLRFSFIKSSCKATQCLRMWSHRWSAITREDSIRKQLSDDCQRTLGTWPKPQKSKAAGHTTNTT